MKRGTKQSETSEKPSKSFKGGSALHRPSPIRRISLLYVLYMGSYQTFTLKTFTNYRCGVSWMHVS